MAAGDEPDFGFLNNDAQPPEPSDQFSFTEPTDTSPAPPATPPEAEPRPTSDKASFDKASSEQTRSEPPISEQAAAPAAKRRKLNRPTKKPQTAASKEESSVAGNSETEGSSSSGDTVPKSQFLALAVFAGLVSILLMLQMLGIISLGGSHQLESVPDVAPLKEGEFQAVPETAVLPRGHELKLGQTAQFGDVLLTPTKVVREPIRFAQMTSGKADDNMTSQDVLKLYFKIQNKSDQFAFAPWDVALMNHRTPEEGIDLSTKANSWLKVTSGTESQRILNFFHSPNSNFNIVGMQSRVPLQPDESRETFIASSEGVDGWLVQAADLRWRLQLRKGIHQTSKRSVTTFVDVTFAEGDIQQL
ncbi:MAG: hypothetical protein ABJZ55_09625 [Fuerstiella sp.]